MVDESTRMVLKKKGRQSLLKTLLVLLVVLLFMGTTIIFVVLLNPTRQVVADPLATPTNVSIDETGIQNDKQYTISFDAVDNADYYTLFVFASAEEAQSAVDTGFANLYPTLSFNGTSKDITTYLSEKGMYYFSVQAICKSIPSFSSDPSDPFEEGSSVEVDYYLSTPTVTVTVTPNDEYAYGYKYQCSWEPIDQATSYEIDVVRADTQISVLTNVIEVSGNDYVLDDAILTLMNNQSTTDFDILVRAIGSDQYIENSDFGSGVTHTYKTVTTPLVEYSYTTPNNVETYKLKWQLLSFARYFEIYINNQLVETITGSTITEVTINNYVQSCGTYTARVVARNDSAYVADASSDEITFDVYATTPTVTGLTAYRNGTNIVVQWNADSVSTTYMIYVRNKENEVIVPPNSDVEYSVVSNSGFFDDMLITWNDEGYYSISVVAQRDDEYYSPSSATTVLFQFVTTELSAPVATYNENDNTLVWQAVANSSGNPMASDNNGFGIKLWTLDGDGEEVEVLNTVVAKSLRSYDLSDILAEKGVNTYYVSVKALGGYLIWQDSVESETISFKYTEPLSTPQNVTITDDDSGASATNPTLSWSVVDNAVGYKIAVNGTDTQIIVTVGETYTISGNYSISEDESIISVTGWDTHFSTLSSGTYTFTVKAIADATDDSVYTDSAWSSGADFILTRTLTTPVILSTYQDVANTSNALYVRWDRIDGEDTIYDENLQTFNIFVNGTKVVSSLLPNNARADGITDYYQYNIGDYLTPGTTNTVAVEAVAYGLYDSAKSDTQTEISYYYYLQSAYGNVTPVQIVGEAHKMTDDVTGEVTYIYIYTLYFNNLKFANKYEFTFNNDDAKYVVKNVFNNRATGIETKTDISSSWIVAYSATPVRVVISYDDTLSAKDATANASYIIPYDWNYSYIDEARLAPVENLSYDGGSRFSWTYSDDVIDGVGHFTYSYQFTSLSEDAQTGTSPKSNSYVDGGVTYYYVDVDFAYADEIEFSITPISSSVKRKNGETVTDTFDIKTTLDTPKDLIIKEDNNGLYIQWSPVNNVVLTNAYTIQLYADGVQVGTDLLVGNSSDTIKVYGSQFNITFNNQVTYYAKVKCNAHSPTAGNTDYHYRESAWAISADYSFTPKIYAPLISIDDNELQVLKAENADTYIIYCSTSLAGENKQDITEYLTSVTEDDSYRTYDLTTYFNVNNLITGTYYISVVAKNSEWNKSSVESDMVAYDYNIEFDAPQVNDVKGSTTTMTMDWDAVTGTDYGELSVNPVGYQITIGLSNRSYARLVTLQVLYDATVGYKIRVIGGTTYSPNSVDTGTSSVIYSYDAGTLTVYANSFEFVYNSAILTSKSDYVADFITMANSSANFVASNTTSFNFTCYSVTITAPIIYFYDGTSDLISTYETSSDSLILYILKRKYSQTFDIQGMNLFESGEVVTLYKQSGQEVDLNGSTYKVYQLSISNFANAGIYQIRVKYNSNKTAGAGESDYSNILYLYRSVPVKTISNAVLTTRSTGSYSPVGVTITLPTSQITSAFRGFYLKTSTTETTPRTTIFTLGTTGSYGYTRSDNTSTKVTTITCQIPIAEITGFGSTWQTLTYDFKFDIQVLGNTATTGLISEYGLTAQCLDSFVFYTNSTSISTTLNTSAQTSKPSNIQLDTAGKVSWSSSGTNVTYYYIYYAWDLTTNSYTLFYNNGGTITSESLTVTDDVLYLSDGITELSSINAGDAKWFSTTSTSFNIQDFSSTIIYGVYLYAERTGVTASDIVKTTLASDAVLPAFTTADMVITYDGTESRYYLTWTDVFATYDSSLVTNKDGQYVVYFGSEGIITLDSISAGGNTFYQDGKVYLDITDIIVANGRGPYTCRITIKAFSVTALDTSTIHNILLSKTVEGSVYSPLGISSTVSNVSVIWDSDKTVCLASWTQVENATRYNLLLTDSEATASDLKDGSGNLYTSETSNIVLGNKVVSINEIDISSIQYDITDWLSSLSLPANSYKLWLCVADDDENNIISSENLNDNSSALFTYYAVCNSVTNLTYSSNSTTRIKTVSWTNDLMNGSTTEYAYKYVVYKLQLKDATTNEFVELTTGVYAVYFKNDANENWSAFSGFTFGDANVIGSNVVIDVTDLFESISAGDYVLYITACPSSNVSEYKNSVPTIKTIQNNRQLVLNSSTYMSIMVDSYIASVINGVVSYTDNELVNTHLDSYDFNTKVITLLQDLPEGSIGLGVNVYEYVDNAWTQSSINIFYNTESVWKLNLGAGLYKFDIYAIGDSVYYSDSTVKQNDIENLEVYTRHTIDDSNSSVTINRDDDSNITGIYITHGISTVNSSYKVYCYEYDGTYPNGDYILGDLVWVSDTKTTTSARTADILGDIMANADDMSFAGYVFKVQWLATTVEKSENILDSDLDETKGMYYSHEMNVQKPQLQKDTNGNVVLVGYDTEGYVVSTQLKWSVDSPLINSVLEYQVDMWDKNKTNKVSYLAYVKVTYSLVGSAYVPTYELLNSGLYVSDTQFSLTNGVLTFDMLSYIDNTSYTVGKYYFNVGLVDVIKVYADNSTEDNVVNLNSGNGVWYYNQNYEEAYTHQDIYATASDKWNVDDAGSDLYISNIALNLDTASNGYGILSWNFTDNGTYNKAWRFVINVNGTGTESTIYVEYSSNQTNYSYDLRDRLWADDSTTVNVNNVTIRLQSTDVNWLNTPVISVISNLGLSSIYDETFIWETDLAIGGTISNALWDTDSQEVSFNYIFNKYYEKDGQLYTDDGQLSTMVRYMVEVLYSTDNFSAQTFASAYASGSLSNRKYISISQAQIEAWIVYINSNEYKMTFNPEDENTYGFNLESLLNRIDASTWIDSGTSTLYSGYYYVNISLVDNALDGYDSAYENGSVWNQPSYVKAPWKISNTTIVDGHTNSADQTLILASDSLTDDEKYAWADDESKSVYLDFNVEKINGQIPSGYEVIAYYKLISTSDEVDKTFVRISSLFSTVQDNGDYVTVRLNISDLFNESGDYAYVSGMYTFRVIGLGNEVAKDSTLISSIQTSYSNALINYVRLGSVVSGYTQDNENSSLELYWTWNFPEGLLATVSGKTTTTFIEPTLQIYNYKTDTYSGNLYGSDSFNMVNSNYHDNVIVVLNGVVGTSGSYTHSFISGGSALNIIRSLSEESMVYNYLSYQVIVPTGCAYYLLNSEIVQQPVTYVSGYGKPTDVTVENRKVNNEYIYVLEDDNNLNDSYNQISFTLNTESFVNSGTYNNKEIKYSYVQMRVYKYVNNVKTLVNGANGVIFKISYYSASNTGATIASIELCDALTGETITTLSSNEYTGSVDLITNYNISITLSRVQLGWLFDSIEGAHTPDTYNVELNIYTFVGNAHNSIGIYKYIHNVRMEAPVIDSIEFVNNTGDDDNPDIGNNNGIPYLIYTGEEPNFTIKLTVSDVSDNTDTLYVTVANGTGSQADLYKYPVTIRKADGTLQPWVTQTETQIGTQTYIIIISKAMAGTSTLFENIVDLIPNELYFYIQAVNSDLLYYTEYENGKFTELLANVEATYIDSYRCDIVDTYAVKGADNYDYYEDEVSRELANPTFEFGFSVINDESAEWQSESASIDGVTTNLVGSGSNYQVAYPYVYISNYDGTVNPSGSMSEIIDFEVEFKCDLNSDGAYTADETKVVTVSSDLLMSNDTTENYNFYNDISDLISKAQGKIIIFTVYAKHGDTNYWLDQDYANNTNNNSEAQSLLFYHNVSVKDASVGTLTFSDTETTVYDEVTQKYISTGLLKPADIPLSWTYDAKGTTQTVSGYRVVIEGENSEDEWGFIDTDTTDTTLNLVIDKTITSNWQDKNFDFNNWANLNSGNTQGVWSVQVSPYYVLDNGFIVYGTPTEYQYSLVLKLSNLRDVTTTYSFNTAFTNLLVGGLADMSNTSVVNMIKTSEEDTNGSAVNVDISKIGSVITAKFCNGFQIQVRKNSSSSWKTLNSLNYSSGALTEFSIENFTACLDSLMNTNHFVGGVYELRYMLNEQTGVTLASDWSNIVTFTYCKAYDGSSTTLTQSGTNLVVGLSADAINYSSSLGLAYYLLQNDYSSGYPYSTNVTSSTSSGSISRFSVSKLEALTLTVSNLSSSKLASGYVYDSSNVGYIQLGLDTVKHIVSLADTTYNVGYISTLSTTFSLPSGYGPSLLTSDANAASIVTLVEGAAVQFYSGNYLSSIINLTTSQAVVNGKTTTTYSVNSPSLTVLNTTNVNGIDVFSQAGVSTTLSMKAFKKMGSYIDSVNVIFNNYNYVLSISNISGLTNTTVTSNSFYGDGIAKTKTVSFTYTLTYFAFGDGNAFTSYGVRSISQTKSYSTSGSSSSLEEVDSTVDIATVYGDADIWYSYDSGGWPAGNIDGWFKHNYKFQANLTTSYSGTQVKIKEYVHLETYYWNQTGGGVWLHGIYSPPVYDEYTWYTSENTGLGITLTATDPTYDDSDSVSYCLGIQRVNAMDKILNEEQNKAETVYYINFTLTSDDIISAYNSCIGNS